jgi:2-amino-4-hydroxy-6-hydroxymethyldihydropteridine diphosphokinase
LTGRSGGSELRCGGPADPRWTALALGSNLGDREEHLARAREAISGQFGPICRLSRIYETDPVGPAGQGPYLNQVLLLAVLSGAAEMITPLHEIEARLGRQRAEIWGARTIDIDILFQGSSVNRDARLTLPHPRLHERPFVLVPLAEVLPEWRHPVLRLTVAEMLARAGAGGVVPWRARPQGRGAKRARG